MKETHRIEMANGPGMTVFGTNGRYAFVCSSFVRELAVVDVASLSVAAHLPQASPFCPNIAVSPENEGMVAAIDTLGRRSQQCYRTSAHFHDQFLEIVRMFCEPTTSNKGAPLEGPGRISVVGLGQSNRTSLNWRFAVPKGRSYRFH